MSKMAKAWSPDGESSMVEVVVDLPASYCIGSDQYGGKLIEVSGTGHKVTWQRVKADGTANAQMTCEFTWRAKSGEYRSKGNNYGWLKLGTAETMLDEGF